MPQRLQWNVTNRHYCVIQMWLTGTSTRHVSLGIRRPHTGIEIHHCTGRLPHFAWGDRQSECSVLWKSEVCATSRVALGSVEQDICSLLLLYFKLSSPHMVIGLRLSSAQIRLVLPWLMIPSGRINSRGVVRCIHWQCLTWLPKSYCVANNAYWTLVPDQSCGQLACAVPHSLPYCWWMRPHSVCMLCE